jgi:RNA polymerase sigma factor (sigma-70 family)
LYRLNEAQKEIVEKNIRLVYFVLKKAGISRSRSDYEDLFSAGCVGLCTAASVWRIDGSPFSTFAYHLIRHEVIAAVKRSDRDRHRLKPLDELSDYAAVPDEKLEKNEADMLIAGFLNRMDITFCDTDAAIIRLAAKGKDCRQISDELGIGISVVYKAKKRARAALDIWLHEGE